MKWVVNEGNEAELKRLEFSWANERESCGVWALRIWRSASCQAVIVWDDHTNERLSAFLLGFESAKREAIADTGCDDAFLAEWREIVERGDAVIAKQQVVIPSVRRCWCGHRARAVFGDDDMWQVMCDANHVLTKPCATENRAVCRWNARVAADLDP